LRFICWCLWKWAAPCSFFGVDSVPDWATWFSGLLFSVVMLGALVMVHGKNGWNSINMGPDMPGQGMEFQLLILATALYFAFQGNSANAAA